MVVASTTTAYCHSLSAIDCACLDDADWFDYLLDLHSTHWLIAAGDHQLGMQISPELFHGAFAAQHKALQFTQSIQAAEIPQPTNLLIL